MKKFILFLMISALGTVFANAQSANLSTTTMTLDGKPNTMICVRPNTEYTICLTGCSCNAAYILDESDEYTITYGRGGLDATNGRVCGFRIKTASWVTGTIYIGVKALGQNYVDAYRTYETTCSRP